jgi:holo-[acyl-carrier protein] synthase
MVLGVGTDLIEIARIAHSIDRFGDRFLLRVFTPREIAYCQRKKNAAESYAARFAAKEAGAKALGTGISQGISWLELEVVRQPSGRPTLHLTGRAAQRALHLGVANISLSLTHSKDIALAVVVMEDQSGIAVEEQCMSSLQKLLFAILPRKWARSLESESRAWIFRCSCGFEQSWWDAGGIRWKAAGHPRRWMRCPHCGQNTWHTTSKNPPTVDSAEHVV